MAIRPTHTRSRLRALAALLASLVVIGSALAPTAAEAALLQARPQPAVWDVTPATGEVVAPGVHRMAGTIASDTGVASASLYLDGLAVTHVVESASESTMVVSAAVNLTLGEHVLGIRATDGAGQPVARDWRVSVKQLRPTRLSGPTRVDTAVAIARRDRQPRAAQAAVLARADDFADALAGVSLAHAVDGPLLLSARDELSPASLDALRDLIVAGGTVHLLGGVAALSQAVADAVVGAGFAAVRHGGSDRYETAANIARALPEPPTGYVLVSGASFPDALSAAAPAARTGRAILLASADLPAATRALLRPGDDLVIVGGTSAVPSAAEAEVEAIVGPVDRVAGPDRYETSRLVTLHFRPAAGVIGLASGEDFADGLAGAVDVARDGGALLLTRPTRIPAPIQQYLRAAPPITMRVFGGSFAVHDATMRMAVASADNDGPRIVRETPGGGTELHDLGQLQIDFDREIVLEHSSLSVRIEGQELPVAITHGDFSNTLVLDVAGAGITPALFQPYDLRVTGIVAGTDIKWRNIDHVFTFRKVAMSSGDIGAEVTAVQQRLLDLGYWLPQASGTFDSLTSQAIMAFQGYEGLPVTGTADANTQQRLAHASRPVPLETGPFHLEIDKSRQVLMVAESGTTRWTFHVSTGSEIPYDEEGGSGNAVTPVGRFSICHSYDGLREAPLGTLWRPRYFHCGRGIAVHGAPNVPNHPASHGCVRVTFRAMDFIWSEGLMPMGATVVVYGAIPPR